MFRSRVSARRRATFVSAKVAKTMFTQVSHMIFGPTEFTEGGPLAGLKQGPPMVENVAPLGWPECDNKEKKIKGIPADNGGNNGMIEFAYKPVGNDHLQSARLADLKVWGRRTE